MSGANLLGNITTGYSTPGGGFYSVPKGLFPLSQQAGIQIFKPHADWNGQSLAQHQFNDLQWLKLAAEAQYNCRLLAASFGVSQRQLERQFLKLVADSPQNWLDQLRMVQGRFLLQADFPIKIVASELKFPDVSNFYRHFRKTYGVTPREYILEFKRRCADKVPLSLLAKEK